MDKIVIIGYGGHAKSIRDSIISGGKFEIVGYTDVEDKRDSSLTYLGSDSILPDLIEKGVRFAAMGIGYLGKSDVRDVIYRSAKAVGLVFPPIIDPSAIVSGDVQIGEGTFIGKCAVVNTHTCIGKLCIINTASVLEHDNDIGDFTHIAVGATLCGNVSVDNHCLIGANATVIQGIQIGEKSIVGAGAVVIKNVAGNMTVVGTPAFSIRG